VKLRTASESVGWLNTEGPLTVSPKFDIRRRDTAADRAFWDSVDDAKAEREATKPDWVREWERDNELAPRIAACRAATKAYRDAWKLADDLTRELKALGLCGHCAIDEHRACTDYGCVCCGGGK
jgi:hypothetical protein